MPKLTVQKVQQVVTLIASGKPVSDYDNEELSLYKKYKLDNPHNYPAFFCEGIGVIYAVNKESADKQEARILKKRKQAANGV